MQDFPTRWDGRAEARAEFDGEFLWVDCCGRVKICKVLRSFSFRDFVSCFIGSLPHGGWREIFRVSGCTGIFFLQADPRLFRESGKLGWTFVSRNELKL